MKLISVVGARPQFVKLAPLSRRLRQYCHEVIVHTRQHYDVNMSDSIFRDLEIPVPDYNLGVGSGSHGQQTGKSLMGLEEIYEREKPQLVIVFGDTNATLAGALGAAKLNIPIAHVEAGLRSFNMAMPEEINRILTDRIAHWLFTPTDTAHQNLRQEGVAEERIMRVGDVMFDVARHFGEQIDAKGRIIGRLDLTPGDYVLATVHRAENTDDPQRLAAVVDAFERTARELPVVWPIHPRTRGVLKELGKLDRLAEGVHVIEPVSYLDMVQLEKYAAVIATDSGGVQKEAFFYQVPCVTLRDETEWVELVSAGWNRLAPPVDGTFLARTITSAVGSAGKDVRTYGEGDAADKIVLHLGKCLGE